MSAAKANVHITLVSRSLSLLFLSRVNVDFENQSVCPVGVVSGTIDPDKLPPNRLFVVNVTEVSTLHLTRFDMFQKRCCENL